ncbi:MAG TPA: UvrD-helicase domain-containing protein [Anaerolineaceae bacterium]|nr:UvrD-helicase domain-containing protein [Anaerolineaceae bacterium]HPN51721.1 UvrD-helicase domain-containing protein [Anaerolineaceae bacterium]
MQRSPQQDEVIHSPHPRIFLEGPAGTGKTTVGVERLLYLLEKGVPAQSILLLFPQRTLSWPYQQALNQTSVQGSLVNILTVGGLARRMVDLFWPVIGSAAGFKLPDQPPVFLTLETAQYFMAEVLAPLLEKGYFESVRIDRNRLYSQLLDNLNKAAIGCYSAEEIGSRLSSAWIGEPGQLTVYRQVQEAVLLFRNYCLQHNLLDFSLQFDLLRLHLWPREDFQSYLLKQYSHLIYDNIEEDTPYAHDLIRSWLPDFQSALIICDKQAGFRRFLGADSAYAGTLQEDCGQSFHFSQSFTISPAMQALHIELGKSLKRNLPTQPAAGDPRDILAFSTARFQTQMLDNVAAEITSLVKEEKIPPGEIAILTPFLSDSLRFLLQSRLQKAGIQIRTHRPSRSLKDEPAVACMLTLACLAHPDWGLHPTRLEVSRALLIAIDDLDPIRAQLLAETLYRGKGILSSFTGLQENMQHRITFVLGNRFETLRVWLAQIQQTDPPLNLDHFFSLLFGEVLSQPGFGFHNHFDHAAQAASLMESIRKFRQAVAFNPELSSAKAYIEMVQSGIIAAQYLSGWMDRPMDAVLLAPAYTFLMSNYPVDIQFWLDIGHLGWWERLDQPLTQPYVLARTWPPGQSWTDAHEYESSQETLFNLVTGLSRRCRKKIYLAVSELSEQGYEQSGQLLRAVDNMLHRLQEDRHDF